MIARTPARRARRGFTLLELLLATLLAGMLLTGLYAALTMTLQQTQASRDAVDAEDLSRAVFNKVSLDLSNVLGPLPPQCGGDAASASITATTGTGTDTGMGAGTGMGTGMGTGTDTGMGATADPAAEPVTPTIPFQAGMVGSEKQLTLFVSRVPDILARAGALNRPPDGAGPVPSDMYRIDYWVGTNGGLCRMERPWVTAQGVGDTLELDRGTEDQCVIAEDVVDASFEYLAAGGGFTGSWDLTELAPPKAIKVTLVFRAPGQRSTAVEKTVSQIIAVRTAPGVATPVLVDPVAPSGTTTTPATSGTGGGGMGGGGTGGGGTGGGGTGGGGMGGGGRGGGAGGGGTGGGGAGGGRGGGGGAGGGGAKGGG